MSHNLENILNDIINLMEIVEEMNTPEDPISGSEKKDYVITRMSNKLELLYDDYEEQIETIIESIIFVSKLKRTLMLNNPIKKCINKKCFRF